MDRCSNCDCRETRNDVDDVDEGVERDRACCWEIGEAARADAPAAADAGLVAWSSCRRALAAATPCRLLELLPASEANSSALRLSAMAIFIAATERGEASIFVVVVVAVVSGVIGVLSAMPGDSCSPFFSLRSDPASSFHGS